RIQVNQYPSPMVEDVRAHERIENKEVPGLSIMLENILSKPVEVYIPDHVQNLRQVDLLIHFHGLSYVPKSAVYSSEHPLILAVINLGSGSSVYERPFQNGSVFHGLIEAVRNYVSVRESTEIEISRIFISSFSAGYGAVRAILKKHMEKVDGIALLDGLHTDYVPDRMVLSEGGELNKEKLKDFVQFALFAVEGKKRFLITHSEIFPGTYASTTETADHIVSSLNLKKDPVLKWGPVGMQMVSEAKKNGLTILGFAGNTAPDHFDHLHGLPEFLNMILNK
ncbi:hypothetical protein ACFL4T_14485, partial [candidate division KSB1 bacterium]